MAVDDYNSVLAGDRQYAACIDYAHKNYEGGNERSPVNSRLNQGPGILHLHVERNT